MHPLCAVVWGVSILVLRARFHNARVCAAGVSGGAGRGYVLACASHPVLHVAARARRHALVRAADDDTDLFEVSVPRPLGISLREQEGIGVVVSAVSEGSNALAAGISVGDVVLATSASCAAASSELPSSQMRFAAVTGSLASCLVVAGRQTR